MKRVEGNAEVQLLECTNPVKNKWRIRWDMQEDENGAVTYMEEEFPYRPTENEIRTLITGWYNKQIDEAILSGFVYEGMPIWLSSENQFNYKAAYDLAMQTAGATLPVTFKFGTDTEPLYREFAKLDELTDFYVKAMQHVQNTLADGWKKKDAFNVNLYRME